MNKQLSLPPEAIEQFRSLLDTYDRLEKDARATAPATPAPNAENVQPASAPAPGTGPVPPPPAQPSPVLPPPLPGTDAEIKLLRDRLASNTLWWTDLIQAELCVIAVLDGASVRARVGGWRRRMHEVIGDERYDQYLTPAPNPRTAPLEEVRADLAECVRAVYYFYSAYGVAARSRSDVTQSTFTVALCILGIEGLIALVLGLPAWLNWSLQIPNPPLAGLEYLIATSAAAVIGSVISVQTRLQDPSVDADPFYRYVQTHADKLSIAYVSPIFASIFGLVIFGLMGSGLIGGAAFPKVDALLASPTLKDLTLLLIYGCAAGFAERLVPDALTRIAAQALDATSGSKQAQSAPGAAPAKAALTLPSISVAAGSDTPLSTTFSATDPGITAVSSDPTTVTVNRDATATGSATFTVHGVAAGDATVTITSGDQKATVNVTVT